jgi:leucine dehydrogenase
MKVYETPADGLADAMRLSGAMTRKLAVAGLPFGGGKGVIAVPELPIGEQRRELFLRYGELVESLGGTYRTSSDMNTGEADMDVIGERTEYVFGKSVAAGGSGNPAAPTSLGVFHGIRASLDHAFGSEELRGRVVLVQGAGGVGSLLAPRLAEEGASVLVADVDPGRAAEVAAAVGGETLPAEGVYETECDVYAPCAVGGTLSADTVPRLRCRVVAGSANNQLATADTAALLRERGILYAPDFVVNAGGLINIAEELRGYCRERAVHSVERVFDTTLAVLDAARRTDRDTHSTAVDVAAARISASEGPGYLGSGADRCGSAFNRRTSPR